MKGQRPGVLGRERIRYKLLERLRFLGLSEVGWCPGSALIRNLYVMGG